MVCGVGVCVFLRGGVVVLGCACCLMAFVNCVVDFVGDVGSRDGKMWLSGGAGLCIVCFRFCACVCFEPAIVVGEWALYSSWLFSSYACSAGCGCCWWSFRGCGMVVGSGVFGWGCR